MCKWAICAKIKRVKGEILILFINVNELAKNIDVNEILGGVIESNLLCLVDVIEFGLWLPYWENRFYEVRPIIMKESAEFNTWFHYDH